MFLALAVCYALRSGFPPAWGGMARQRLEVLVSGRVQGVWFRAATREEARRLGLQGWVRNLPDGRVAALFEGDESALEGILAWCRVGPPGAKVDAVETACGQATGAYSGFTIVR